MHKEALLNRDRKNPATTEALKLVEIWFEHPGKSMPPHEADIDGSGIMEGQNPASIWQVSGK